MSDKVIVHLPEVADSLVTQHLYEADIEMYIDSAGPGLSNKWPASITIDTPGNVDSEDQTVLDADQAEELALRLLFLVRQLREGGTTAPWSE